ncbi:MAG: hypothetical protein K9I85_05415 [Saprospiraceae bacterium]|nr:hypothetical protein [Saprospiraceae bacterium]
MPRGIPAGDIDSNGVLLIILAREAGFQLVEHNPGFVGQLLFVFDQRQNSIFDRCK